MTTHSPSTVAMAREGSVYGLGTGGSFLEKLTKSEAIDLLTSGVPTLSLDYDGRRTVFTEGEDDAKLLSAAYSLVRKKIRSELSLEFINVGTKSAKGELNGGCDQVRSIVSRLREAGNNRIFGVIDWDESSQTDESSGIYVLAEGERYAIENCIFDPLLVAAAVFKERGDDLEKLGIRKDTGVGEFLSYTPASLQALVSNVETAVLGESGDSHFVEVEYECGAKLDVRADYLGQNAKSLAASVRHAFPSLLRLHQEKKLMEHMIKVVMPEYQEFIPLVFRQCFERLLTAK